MPQTSDAYFVGNWLVEPSVLRISRNEQTKKIEPQVMAVLECLVSKPGQVVSKEDLRTVVWAGVIVTENVLTRAISSLRKALEDDRYNPQYIETISKTGYRLVAPVKTGMAPKEQKGFLSVPVKRLLLAGVGVMLLLVLSTVTTMGVLNPPAPEIYHPVALANNPNSEYWPAISPDGKFVAYGWKGEEDDNWDIYAKLIGTETVIRVTDHPATELRAKWSADGNYIFFIRYEKGGSILYKRSVFGKEETRVMAAPVNCFGDFDVSADGKWISFNGRETPSGPLRINLTSLENSTVRWLTSPEPGFKGDIHPTFSPDGSRLAFIREKNPVSMQLWLLDLSNGESEQITSGHLSINGFDWSETGNALLYCSDKTGLYKLWEVSLRNRKSRLLPVGDYQMVMPRVAETGRIVYARMQDNVNIWTYDLKHKAAKPWRANDDLNLNAVRSPDGEKICFTTNRGGAFQLWISESDPSEAKPITNSEWEYINAPRWSADNRTLVFHAYRNGQADIYRVNARGGIPKNLTNSKADDHTPFFSRSGQIYFSSNRSGEWAIWRMEAEGGKPVEVRSGNAYAPQVSGDEKELYYSKKDRPGLWNYNLETKTEQLLVEAFHPMYWGAFALSEEGIYYLNPQNRRFEFFDRGTGRSTNIYQPQGRVPRLGITLYFSTRFNQLLFSQIDRNDADIVLLEHLLNE